MALQSNAVSHWLGASLESFLYSDQSTILELTYVIVNNSFLPQHGNDKVISVKWINIIYRVGEWYFLIFNYFIRDLQLSFYPLYPKPLMHGHNCIQIIMMNFLLEKLL